MSQHWDPFQQNKPCFHIFLLEQFIANSSRLLFLFPLPSFPPFPLLPLAVLCCLCGKKRAPALAKSDINSFLSGDVQQNLPLINICSVSEPQGYWLHFVFIVVCFLTLCRPLYIKILPPACLRPGAEWGSEQDIPRCLPGSPTTPFPWNKSLFVSLWTRKSWYWREKSRIRSTDLGLFNLKLLLFFLFPFFFPLLLFTDFLISFPSML